MNHATHDAGPGASPADGPWLDMSGFPDLDPDTALAPGDADLLSSALAVDEGALPDDVWARMLQVTWEQPLPDAVPDGDDGGAPDLLADDPGGPDVAHDATVAWSAGRDDVDPTRAPDPTDDPAHHPDEEHDPAAWGGDLA